MPEEITRRVKFDQDYEVRDHRAGTPEAEKYKRGKTVKMVASSAAHFVARGLAHYVGK